MSNNHTNTLKIIDPEIRVNFVSEIKNNKYFDKDVFNNVIKGNINRTNIEKLIKKLFKYNGNKELDIFVDNIIYNNNDTLIEFLNNFNIKFQEENVNITYNFKMDEPKLIDSKKQNEWIKSLINIDNNYAVVGLFNSELNLYNINSRDKLEIINYNILNNKKNNNIDNNLTNLSKEENFNKFLNSIDVSYVESKGDYVYMLIFTSIRDSEYDIEYTELAIDTTKNTYYKKQSSYCGSNNYNNLTCLSVSPFNKNCIVAGTTNGNIQMYTLDQNYENSLEKHINDNLEFYNNNNNINFNKKNSREKTNIKHTITPNQSLFNSNYNLEDISTEQFTCFKWLNPNNIVSSSNNYIKIFSSLNLTLIKQIHLNHHLCSSIDVLDKESQIVSAHDNGSVKFWDIRNKNPLCHNIKSCHKGYVSYVKNLFNENINNNNNIITCGYDGEVKLWDRRNLSSYYYILPADGNKDKIFTCCSFINKTSLNNESNNILITGGASEYLNFYRL